MSKYDVKTRGTNTKEHWEGAHNNMFIFHWKGVEGEALEEMVRNNWWHYVWAIEDVEKNKASLTQKSILDVGCAPNKCLAFYAARNPDVNFLGIDFTDAIVEYGKEFPDFTNLSFKKLDFLEEEIPGTYGAILLMETLEHVEDGTNWKLVEELLSKCEYLYISVPADHGTNDGEHISFYDSASFDKYNVLEKREDRMVQMFKLKGAL